MYQEKFKMQEWFKEHIEICERQSEYWKKNGNNNVEIFYNGQIVAYKEALAEFNSLFGG